MNWHKFNAIVLIFIVGCLIWAYYELQKAKGSCCAGYPADLVCKSVCKQRGMNYSHYEGYHTLNPDHQIEDLKCICKEAMKE